MEGLYTPPLPEDSTLPGEDPGANEESKGGVDHHGSVDEEHESRVYLACDDQFGCQGDIENGEMIAVPAVRVIPGMRPMNAGMMMTGIMGPTLLCASL